MKIGISNDHSAVELKMAIMDYLSKKRLSDGKLWN